MRQRAKEKGPAFRRVLFAPNLVFYHIRDALKSHKHPLETIFVVSPKL